MKPTYTSAMEEEKMPSFLNSLSEAQSTTILQSTPETFSPPSSEENAETFTEAFQMSSTAYSNQESNTVKDQKSAATAEVVNVTVYSVDNVATFSERYQKNINKDDFKFMCDPCPRKFVLSAPSSPRETATSEFDSISQKSTQEEEHVSISLLNDSYTEVLNSQSSLESFTPEAATESEKTRFSSVTFVEETNPQQEETTVLTSSDAGGISGTEQEISIFLNTITELISSISNEEASSEGESVSYEFTKPAKELIPTADEGETLLENESKSSISATENYELFTKILDQDTDLGNNAITSPTKFETSTVTFSNHDQELNPEKSTAEENSSETGTFAPQEEHTFFKSNEVSESMESSFKNHDQESTSMKSEQDTTLEEDIADTEVSSLKNENIFSSTMKRDQEATLQNANTEFPSEIETSESISIDSVQAFTAEGEHTNSETEHASINETPSRATMNEFGEPTPTESVSISVVETPNVLTTDEQNQPTNEVSTLEYVTKSTEINEAATKEQDRKYKMPEAKYENDDQRFICVPCPRAYKYPKQFEQHTVKVGYVPTLLESSKHTQFIQATLAEISEYITQQPTVIRNTFTDYQQGNTREVFDNPPEDIDSRFETQSATEFGAFNTRSTLKDLKNMHEQEPMFPKEVSLSSQEPSEESEVNALTKKLQLISTTVVVIDDGHELNSQAPNEEITENRAGEDTDIMSPLQPLIKSVETSPRIFEITTQETDESGASYVSNDEMHSKAVKETSLQLSGNLEEMSATTEVLSDLGQTREVENEATTNHAFSTSISDIDFPLRNNEAEEVLASKQNEISTTSYNNAFSTSHLESIGETSESRANMGLSAMKAPSEISSLSYDRSFQTEFYEDQVDAGLSIEAKNAKGHYFATGTLGKEEIGQIVEGGKFSLTIQMPDESDVFSTRSTRKSVYQKGAPLTSLIPEDELSMSSKVPVHYVYIFADNCTRPQTTSIKKEGTFAHTHHFTSRIIEPHNFGTSSKPEQSRSAENNENVAHEITSETPTEHAEASEIATEKNASTTTEFEPEEFESMTLENARKTSFFEGSEEEYSKQHFNLKSTGAATAFEPFEESEPITSENARKTSSPEESAEEYSKHFNLKSTGAATALEPSEKSEPLTSENERKTSYPEESEEEHAKQHFNLKSTSAATAFEPSEESEFITSENARKTSFAEESEEEYSKPNLSFKSSTSQEMGSEDAARSLSESEDKTSEFITSISKSPNSALSTSEIKTDHLLRSTTELETTQTVHRKHTKNDEEFFAEVSTTEIENNLVGMETTPCKYCMEKDSNSHSKPIKYDFSSTSTTEQEVKDEDSEESASAREAQHFLTENAPKFTETIHSITTESSKGETGALPAENEESSSKHTSEENNAGTGVLSKGFTNEIATESEENIDITAGSNGGKRTTSLATEKESSTRASEINGESEQTNTTGLKAHLQTMQESETEKMAAGEEESILATSEHVDKEKEDQNEYGTETVIVSQKVDDGKKSESIPASDTEESARSEQVTVEEDNQTDKEISSAEFNKFSKKIDEETADDSNPDKFVNENKITLSSAHSNKYETSAKEGSTNSNFSEESEENIDTASEGNESKITTFALVSEQTVSPNSVGNHTYGSPLTMGDENEASTTENAGETAEAAAENVEKSEASIESEGTTPLKDQEETSVAKESDESLVSNDSMTGLNTESSSSQEENSKEVDSEAPEGFSHTTSVGEDSEATEALASGEAASEGSDTIESQGTVSSEATSSEEDNATKLPSNETENMTNTKESGEQENTEPESETSQEFESSTVSEAEDASKNSLESSETTEERAEDESKSAESSLTGTEELTTNEMGQGANSSVLEASTRSDVNSTENISNYSELESNESTENANVPGASSQGIEQIESNTTETTGNMPSNGEVSNETELNETSASEDNTGSNNEELSSSESISSKSESEEPEESSHHITAQTEHGENETSDSNENLSSSERFANQTESSEGGTSEGTENLPSSAQVSDEAETERTTTLPSNASEEIENETVSGSNENFTSTEVLTEIEPNGGATESSEQITEEKPSSVIVETEPVESDTSEGMESQSSSKSDLNGTEPEESLNSEATGMSFEVSEKASSAELENALTNSIESERTNEEAESTSVVHNEEHSTISVETEEETQSGFEESHGTEEISTGPLSDQESQSLKSSEITENILVENTESIHPSTASQSINDENMVSTEISLPTLADMLVQATTEVENILSSINIEAFTTSLVAKGEGENELEGTTSPEENPFKHDLEKERFSTTEMTTVLSTHHHLKQTKQSEETLLTTIEIEKGLVEMQTTPCDYCEQSSSEHHSTASTEETEPHSTSLSTATNEQEETEKETEETGKETEESVSETEETTLQESASTSATSETYTEGEENEEATKLHSHSTMESFETEKEETHVSTTTHHSSFSTSEETEPNEEKEAQTPGSTVHTTEEPELTENYTERIQEVSQTSTESEPKRPVVYVINNSNGKYKKLNEFMIEQIISTKVPNVELHLIDLNDEGLSKPLETLHNRSSDIDIPHQICSKAGFDSENNCFCNINTYLDTLDNRISKNEEIKAKYSYCKTFFKLTKGLVIENSIEPIKRERRGLIYLDDKKKKSDTLNFDSIEGMFDQSFKLPSSEAHMFYLPTETVTILCSNSSAEPDKDFSWTWSFYPISSPIAQLLPERGPQLVVHEGLLKHAGNYTCKHEKTHHLPATEHWHDVEMLTFPIYQIILNIFYKINDSCSLQIGDTLYAYLPKMISPLLCTKDGDVCSLDIDRPRCLTREDDNYFNVTINVKTTSDFVLRFSTTCDINCKLSVYENVVNMVYKNSEMIEKLPVLSKLDHLPQIDFIPHLNGKVGSPVTIKAPKVVVYCAAGFGLESEKQRVCVVCPPQTFSPDSAAFCTSCPGGQYQPDAGSKSCIQCNSPVDDKLCLRMLYTNTKLFKIYVGVAFAVIVLMIIIIIVWTSGFKDDVRVEDRYKGSLRHRATSNRKDIDLEPGVNAPLLGRSPNRAAPQLPPLDF